MSKNKLLIIFSLTVLVVIFIRKEEAPVSSNEEKFFREVKDLGPSKLEDTPKTKEAIKLEMITDSRSRKSSDELKSENEEIQKVLEELKKKKSLCEQKVKEIIPTSGDIFELEDYFENDFEGAIDILDEIIVVFSEIYDNSQSFYKEIISIAGRVNDKKLITPLLEAYHLEICPNNTLANLYDLVMEKKFEKIDVTEREEFKEYIRSITLKYSKKVLEKAPNSQNLMHVGFFLKIMANQGLFSETDKEEVNFLVERNSEENQQIAVNLFQKNYKDGEVAFFKDSIRSNNLSRDDYSEIIERLEQNYSSSIQR